MQNRLKELRHEKNLSQTDIAKANTANKFDEKDNAERYLNEAGNNVAGYLIKELGVNPADIALYAIAKIVLNEDEED